VSKAIDFGLGFGAGIEIPTDYLSIILEGRYTFGLLDLHENGTFKVNAGVITLSGNFDDADKYQSNGLQIMVGLKLLLGN